MKKELEEALRNIESVCSNARLTRTEQLVLSRNLQSVADACSEKKEKAKKKD